MSLYFSLMIFFKKNRKLYENVIMMWGVGFAVSVSLILLAILQGGANILLNYLSYIFILIHGPFLLLTVESLEDINSRLKKKQLLYFSFFFLLFLCTPLIDFLKTPIIKSIIKIICVAYYIFFIVISYRKNRKIKSELLTTENKTGYYWINIFFWKMGYYIILIALYHALPADFSLNDTFAYIFFVILGLSFLVSICIIGIIGIGNTDTFSRVKNKYAVSEEIENDDSDSLPKKDDGYSNYGLKPGEAILLSEKLKECMEQDKLYKNLNLTLKSLSETLQTYPHYITFVLNSILNQNFYDFINTYRIEEAKLMLLDSKKNNLTILAIAYDCGFNSKSSFNRMFKQKTGLTPTEFRSKFQNENPE